MALMAAAVASLTYGLIGARGSVPGTPTALASGGPGAAMSDVDVSSAMTALRPEGTVLAVTADAGSEDGEPSPFRDELLETPMLTHPDFISEVRRWVRFWETAPARWFPDYLERMTWFEEIVDTTLAAHDLPWSLRYLPVIESGYSPTAVSSAQAVGLWQFMAHTAGDFDIEVGRLVDDRRDPYISTAAAADFLQRLRADFGSWFLALAAYNAGPDRIRRIIERHAPDAERSDALYWAIRPFLPKETADFVPNLFGAIIVASDPEAHGYERPEPLPFAFDEVQVRGRMTFEAAALATGATAGEIARLNPEYLQGATPGDRVVTVRVPPGRAEAFRAYFARADGAGPDR